MIEEFLDPGQAGLRPVLDYRRLVTVGQDPPIEGRQRDVDARRTEVGNEDVAGIGPKRQLPWRPTAGARADVALRD